MKKTFQISELSIEKPTINLTPLIDVVFVILIMFIVIAPLLQLDRIELANGPTAALSSAHSAQETSPIALHVYRDNSIKLNHQIVTSAELAFRLKKAKEEYPQARPQLFHDQNASFGTYQSVKNAAEEAGFAQMDLILKPN
jgi:biopolymer transport protein ExbD